MKQEVNSVISGTNNHEHFDMIDIFRLVCALLILILHINPFDYAKYPSIYYYANLIFLDCIEVIALPFFFVTSGFLVFRKIDIDHVDFDYIFRYLKKIFRLYVIWTIIYFPLEVINSKGSFTFIYFLKKFIFSGCFQLWYLNALMFSVAAISFLLHKKWRIKTILMISFCFHIVAILSQSWYGLLKPVRESFPGLWNLILSIGNIILTTRNGLFFGFFYVSLGMLFAHAEISISKKKNIIYLIIAYGFLLVELALTEYLKIADGHELSFSIIPVTFFLFYIVKESRFRLGKNYELGSLSALMYYLHMWIGKIYRLILSGIPNTMPKATVVFLLSLATTVALSRVIIVLSKKEKYRFLNYFYK